MCVCVLLLQQQSAACDERKAHDTVHDYKKPASAHNRNTYQKRSERERVH